MHTIIERWIAAVHEPELFEQIVALPVEPFRARARAVREKFGPFVLRVDDVVACGDKIAWRWTLTSERGTVHGVNFQRIEGDRVVEHWTLTGA